MAAHGIKMDLEQMTGLIPSTFQVVMILGIMAIISFGLIDRLYKQRGITMIRIVKTEFYKLKGIISFGLGLPSCFYLFY